MQSDEQLELAHCNKHTHTYAIYYHHVRKLTIAMAKMHDCVDVIYCVQLCVAIQGILSAAGTSAQVMCRREYVGNLEIAMF